MAQITTVKLPSYNTPKLERVVGARQTITTRFSPTELSASVTSGDSIVLATIPKYARVTGAGLRVVGSVSAAEGWMQGRILENSTAYVITNPVGGTSSNSGSMVAAPPPVDKSYAKDWEIFVAGNSVLNTATGIIEATLVMDYYAEAG